MMKFWFIALFSLFGISTLTLTYIQTRVAKKHGWRALRERPLFETYWGELSTLERCLLWPGVIMFFVTLIVGTISLLFK